MSQKQFHQELEKGLPDSRYLLTASDAFLLYDALNDIRRVFGGEDPFAVEVFDLGFPEDCPPLSAVVDILRTIPFFASRKTAVIRNLQKLSKKDASKIEDYLLSPSPSTVLIMLHEGPIPKVLGSAALKSVKAISLSIPERDIPVWLLERAQAKGADLTPRAVDYLISAVGTDLGLLHAEIDKVQHAGARGKIDVDTIREVVYAGAEFGTFDLINALDAGDLRKTFRRHESVKRTADPLIILGALNWHYTKRGGRAGASVMPLLHEADISIKSSHQHVIENLLYRLVKNR
ncbi:MAG TPA: DNA polymerase III subunit delta [Dissulfurispiraceae bacterium]|nr:DNA polymerase III subunit delta [Dissulfurispiraceae bacterium]